MSFGAGGGGGGATSVGGNSNSTGGGAGGGSYSFVVNGYTVGNYGGGGGGGGDGTGYGTWIPTNAYTNKGAGGGTNCGGAGAGGVAVTPITGVVNSVTAAVAGTKNTGGGGGGGSGIAGYLNGGNGASGVVIIGVNIPITTPTIVNAVFTFNYPAPLTVTYSTPYIEAGTSITSCNYSLDGGSTYSTTNSVSTNTIIINAGPAIYGKTLSLVIQLINNNGYTSFSSNTFSITIPSYPCFAKGSQILTDGGYIPVETLHPGDLIQTKDHGFVPIWKLGMKTIYHPASKDRLPHQLYRLSPDRYPALTEPLVITGCHSILVEEWSDENEQERASHVHKGEVYITDDRYRLPACADEKAEVHEPAGEYTIYHVALENDDYFMNYGIYANGLLVESCSKRYLAELSGMKLLK